MSFNIALAGINAINGQLNQISNNIANSGTLGFKSGRANFASSYINAMPSGVSIGSTSQSMDVTGNFSATGRGLDAAIAGKGFFISRDTDGSMVYSRAGVFNIDKNGNVTDFMSRVVQGYGADGALGSLTIPTGSIPAQASSSLEYVGNMSADWTKPTVSPFNKDDPKSYNGISAATVTDSLGREHTVTQYFVKDAGNKMQVYYAMDGQNVGNPAELSFDNTGKLVTPTATVQLDLGTPTDAAPMSIAINYAGTTMFGGKQTTDKNRVDGYKAGAVTGVSLAEDGSIEVQYSNGKKLSAGQLAIATFQNENGLVPVDGSGWQASSSTGEPLVGKPGTGMAGKLAVRAVEQSNVDMTAELVSLMGAQQNYQANSKVLSTENEMMRALMQAL
ncbi:flagellar hook-basal body complex protein [Burkholderia sp. AU30280]|uniref:flagellar hook protein FlgE n=1 Tax=Burkholderia sp. AU30280 TaxID=2879628 RepID=UPI001CF494E1|nr:flagellar hook-basal body complex protein [Burkholderia sp. AU30280]MCA8273576.1 flagellar hook-basal body complex protein [Burkholderia sp. AU30280]